MSITSERPPLSETIIPHYGTAVVDDLRYPLQYLEEEFDSAMKGGNGATLFGLRRIGKSSEMLACAERLRRSGCLVICEDAQGKTSEAQLLMAVLDQLPAQGWKDRLMKILGEDSAISKVAREALGKATGATTRDVQEYFGPIAAAIERAIQAADRIVLIIDEFPWLCRNVLENDPGRGRARVDVLLAALRRWRVAGMRMMLVGSIGLIGLGREYGLDLTHLNDLIPLSVPPLEKGAESEAFVRALAAGGQIQGWTDAHTRALLDESAAFYTAMLQRAFQQLTVGGKAAELSRFPEIFAVKIRPDLDEAFYQQFDKRRQRYRMLPNPLPSLLSGLLETVLSSPAPASREELRDRAGAAMDETDLEADLSDALGILREDGFLTVCIDRDGSQNWSAASTLVSAWWKQRRGGPRR
jgi:hypothetical protein